VLWKRAGPESLHFGGFVPVPTVIIQTYAVESIGKSVSCEVSLWFKTIIMILLRCYLLAYRNNCGGLSTCTDRLFGTGIKTVRFENIAVFVAIL
jgi:hypothetical protein